MRLVFAILALSCSDALAAPYSCDPPPAAVRDLDLKRYYSDQTGSVVDQNLLSESEAASAPLKAYLSHVVKDADAAWTATRPEERKARADCAVSWIATWARSDALLGNIATKQASYRRTWDMTGIALAYLKVHQHASEPDRAAIHSWLERLAAAGEKLFENGDVKRNNQWYWLGLGLAAISTTTNDPGMWLRARRVMQDAADSVDSNGMLPMELARGKRALHYHSFALTALVAIAEIAAARGEDWYAFGDGALHRLVDTTCRGLQSPQIFTAKAGIAQDLPVTAGGGWLKLYSDRFPGKLPPPLPQMRGSHRWLGGDVQNLRIALLASREGTTASPRQSPK